MPTEAAHSQLHALCFCTCAIQPSLGSKCFYKSRCTEGKQTYSFLYSPLCYNMHNTYTVTLRYTGGCAWMVSKYDAILQVGAEHCSLQTLRGTLAPTSRSYRAKMYTALQHSAADKNEALAQSAAQRTLNSGC